MKNKHNILISLSIALLSLTACSDHLFDDLTEPITDTDGIGFSPCVQEMADLMYGMGETRGASSPLTPNSSLLTPNSTPFFEGELTLHTLSLPIVGIHPHTVAAGTYAEQETRATLSDIVPAGDNLQAQLSFHDSLTIWGWAYNESGSYTRQLFKQTLLKKLRGWRSSVHWPYDDGQADYMKFYAVAPAFESLEDLQKVSDATYSSGPVFTYTIPDDPAEQRDLLYGESDPIDVQAGPTGTGRYDTTGETEKEQHLGDDNHSVALNFKHILTCIRFAQGKMPTHVTVKQLQIYNVINQGTYYPEATDAVAATFPTSIASQLGDTGLGNWTLGTSKGTYTIDRFKDGTSTYTPTQYVPDNTAVSPINGSNYYTTSGGENVYITDQVLFLMPQTFLTNDVDAQLRITLSVPTYATDADGNFTLDGSGNRTITGYRDATLTTTLQGSRWRKGYTITYYLTIGNVAEDYYLIADPKVEMAYSTSTTNGTFNVHSYRHYIDYSELDGDTPGTLDTEASAVAWTAVAYAEQQEEPDDEDWTTTPPDYLTVTGASGGTSGSFTLTAMTPARSGNHQDILSTNSQASAVNLANHTPNGDSFSRNPANCYIVNRPGTFGFPLIYGNGSGKATSKGDETIFKDHEGESIWTEWIGNQLNGKDKTTVFQDNEGVEQPESLATQKVVTGYDVPYNATDAGYRAAVIWEDATDLINNVGLDLLHKDYNTGSTSTQMGMIAFEIQSGNIQPGNALIGLYGKKKKVTYSTKTAIHEDPNDDTSAITGYTWSNPTTTYEAEQLIWAWHIWVTDEVYANDLQYTANQGSSNDDKYLHTNADGSHTIEVTNWGTDGTDGTTATILPVNLGWMPDEMDFAFYEPRYVWVKLQQATSGKTATVQIVQHARQPLVTGTSTIYQWGRPTPLRTTGMTASAITTPANAITHPTTVATGWSPASAYWSGTKTLYDPCPPGFQLPSTTTFTGFSLTGASGALLNMWEDAGTSGTGGYFYTQPHTTLTDADRYGNIVYIPAYGYWSDTYEQGGTTTGYYWSDTNGTSMQVTPDPSSGSITFSATTPGSGAAMPIRPVKTE